MISDRIKASLKCPFSTEYYSQLAISTDLMDIRRRTDILITKATARLDRHVTCRLQPLLMN
jgi:hypothetical protein